MNVCVLLSEDKMKKRSNSVAVNPPSSFVLKHTDIRKSSVSEIFSKVSLFTQKEERSLTLQLPDSYISKVYILL